MEAILHDGIKDGLPAVLNRIQLSKNRQMRSESLEEKNNNLEVTSLYANSLSALVRTASVKSPGSLDDLEQYANLMENMSEIQEVEVRINNSVDELRYDDYGFLGTYEDFSFCSTA